MSNTGSRPSLFASRTSPLQRADTGVSPPAFIKVFSTLKRKAVALVSTRSPVSSERDSLPFPCHARFTKGKRSKNLKEFHRMATPPILRRPPTAQSSPIMLSMRAHGLANYPRPPAIRSFRRPTSSRRHTPGSSTSSATLDYSSPPQQSSHPTCKRKPVPMDLGDSTATLVPPTQEELVKPLASNQEKIAHLQDQINALQRAISPPPLAQRPPLTEEQDSSDSDSSYSGDSNLPTHTRVCSESLVKGIVAAAKGSAILHAVNPSSRPSSSDSEKKKRLRDEVKASDEVLADRRRGGKRDAVYDPFGKDTVQIVHALPGLCTSVSLRRQVRSRPVSEAFTISNVSNTARDVLSNLIEPPPPIPSLPPLASLTGGTLFKSGKRDSMIVGQAIDPPLQVTLDEKEKPSLTGGEEDWTLYLGALDYYVDMDSPSTPRRADVVKERTGSTEDWTLQIPPPKYSHLRPPLKSSLDPNAHQLRESYLDMTDPEQWPSPPASPIPSIRSPSPRGVRARTKNRPRHAERSDQMNLLSPLSLALSPPPRSPSPLTPLPPAVRSPSSLSPKLLSVSSPPSLSHRRTPSILSFTSITSSSTVQSNSTFGRRASRLFRATLGKVPREERQSECASGWF